MRYWLLLAPVFIALLYQVGRGLGNTSYMLYWVTAVVLLVRTRSFAFPPAASVLYLALLAWGTLSAALSINPDGAYGKWVQYALLGSSYFITWALVRTIPEFSLERAVRMIGVAGLIGFAYYAAQFLILSMSSDFHPELQVHGLVPAYLAPFALYFIWQTVKGKIRVVLSLACLASLTLLLVFSNSLTEVVTLAGALAVLVFFVVPNKRLLALGGTSLLFIALILAFDPAGHVLSQAEHTHEYWFTFLNQLSSFRTQLWYQAITIPPPNQWLGGGPSNVGLYPPVVINETYKVGHLHNLLLDCWYELGVVGLALYMMFYGAQILAVMAGAANLRSLQHGVMYAAVAGILVATMLEQSYRSYHVAMFVSFLLALYNPDSGKPGREQG
ncbi:O-antigen ligase family protein [Thiobacillus denitrificans]|uniref:O-antigen ligase family protein n=1 Tax=Thiobacillus denitrificans TaxID=36861 RepID=UPI0003813194|nr:O-antigen ligase family protein [Thiobacillus denitrificans]